MKLNLTPLFSTTEVTNEINTPVKIDLSHRKIKAIHAFKNYFGEQTVCITVGHPLQNGKTTYFLKDKRDIQTVIDHANMNGIEVSYT